MNRVKHIFLTVLLFLLAACGGGDNNSEPQTKKMTLALSGTNTAAVEAFTATLTLPVGLLLRTDSSGVPLPTVFSLSSNNSAVQNINFTAHYLPATGISPAVLTVGLLAPNGGLVAGDIFDITCDVAADSAPPATSAVTLSSIDFRDESGATITGPLLSLH